MAHLNDSDLKELGIRALGDRKYLILLVQTVRKWLSKRAI